MIETRNSRQLAAMLGIFAVVHFAIALWHGGAHLSVPVALAPLQMLFVGLVVVTLPLLAALLLWTKLKKFAAVLYTGSMLAALLFGIVNHYILISPDIVRCVPPGDQRMTFIVSAGFVAGSELIGSLLGALALRRWFR